MFRNKFNQGSESSLIEKYKTMIKEIEEDTNKWKISCVYRLGELTLLKWPYYSKSCIDSVQSISRFQWRILQKLK